MLSSKLLWLAAAPVFGLLGQAAFSARFLVQWIVSEKNKASTIPVAFWYLSLLGGLILNLMPCVFPILAIKVMGFTRHADDLRAHRTAGMAYSAGVVVSFVLLGAAIVAPVAPLVAGVRSNPPPDVPFASLSCWRRNESGSPPGPP